MTRLSKIFLLSFLLANMTQMNAQPIPEPTRPKLIMKYADEVHKIGENANEIYKLRGNVEFVQGDAHIRCSRAVFSRINQKAVFYGPVTIFDGKRTLTARRVDYYGLEKIEKASGDVILTSEKNTLTAGYVEYNQELETAQAKDNVKITNLIDNVELTGQTGFYDRNKEYGRLAGLAKIVKVDSTSGDTLRIFGHLLEAWGIEDRMTVEDSVRVKHEDMKTQCGFLCYLAKNDSMLLSGEPVIWQDEQRMSGDTINLILDEMKLKKGWITGKALVEPIDTTSQDLMTGEQIIFTIGTDSTRLVEIIGQATSVYEITEDENGVNSFTGDKINLYFLNNKLNRLLVESNPGLSIGQFKPALKPEKLAADSTDTQKQEL